ncbi:MAG: membrane protein insertion efficiency factor YidD [Nanoarchaeota archaeon]|nr:membrane protein insertion efficiency factor YidD [Nanoarchaeota archaeon]MBU1027778.1 membrane protein insertion efficiency factor YidD [Nanoarchaeota archaeon]
MEKNSPQPINGCCTISALSALLLIGSGSVGGEALSDKKPSQLEQKTEQEVPGFKNFLLKQINYYQKEIGPELKKRLGKEDICKYIPTCSEYAKQAIEKNGSFKGSLMTAKRLCKCNPLSKGGYDPVE